MRLRLTLAGAVLAVCAAVAAAQQPGFKRTVLQQADLSVPGHEAVTAVVDFEPGASAAKHTHPGEEIGYVVEGSLVVEQAGKPPVTVEAGHAFMVPAGTVHGATNKSGARTRVLSTYIVEKGKPLATPAP